jgi:hypothetical protein
MTTDPHEPDGPAEPDEIVSSALPPLEGYDRRAVYEQLLLEARAKYNALRAARLARGGKFDRI